MLLEIKNVFKQVTEPSGEIITVRPCRAFNA